MNKPDIDEVVHSFNSDKKVINCSICDIEILDMLSHNAHPIKKEGSHDRCCKDCNFKHVIPARMELVGLFIEGENS